MAGLRTGAPPHRRSGRRGDLPRLLDGCALLPPPRARPPGARARPRAARRAPPASRTRRSVSSGASRIWRPPRASSRDGLERFLDDWLAQPLFAGLPPERSFRVGAPREHRRGPRSRAWSRRAPARRTRPGTSSAASTCPCSCSPARRPQVRGARRAPGRRDRRQRHPRRDRGRRPRRPPRGTRPVPGRRPTLAHATASEPGGRLTGPRPRIGHSRDSRGRSRRSGAEPEPAGEQGARDELTRPGGARAPG